MCMVKKFDHDKNRAKNPKLNYIVETAPTRIIL